MIGMFLFFALSIFFLCGLFEEKQLATGAIITAYLSGNNFISSVPINQNYQLISYFIYNRKILEAYISYRPQRISIDVLLSIN